MHEASRHHSDDTERRTVAYLEFVAASAIFFIVAVVLYMVFSYRPA
ncbi:MAG: hypothetical protein IT160_05005 [Bryobacterales bacterium]|nr:hypothetical protein [Bryobacterales bacterium]